GEDDGHGDPGRRDRSRGRGRGGAAGRGDGRTGRLGGGGGRRLDVPRRDHLRGPAGDHRLHRPHPGGAQGPPGDAGRPRRQERQRHPAQAVRDLRQHPARTGAARGPHPVLRPRDRPRRHPGERRGPVRGDRAHADRGRRAVPQADQPAGVRADRADRVRVRPGRGPRHGHLRDQGQHHEAHRGHAQAGRRGGLGRLPRDPGAAPHRRRLRPPAGPAARAVRRAGDHQHERGHPVRPGLRAGRRAGVRPVGQPRRRRGDLRGGARLGAGHRRPGHGQPDRDDAHRRAAAAPSRARRRRDRHRAGDRGHPGGRGDHPRRRRPRRGRHPGVHRRRHRPPRPAVGDVGVPAAPAAAAAGGGHAAAGRPLGLPQRRRRRRLHRVPAGARRAGPDPGGAGGRHPAGAEDDLQPGHPGVARGGRRRDVLRRPLPLPVRAAGRRGPARRRHGVRPAAPGGQPVPLDARGEARGAGRHAGLLPRPGGEL
ncbi:MAG: Isocitrate dehydrogenase [NADP], partial [uncultured Corynebacteriales bacterium]